MELLILMIVDVAISLLIVIGIEKLFKKKILKYLISLILLIISIFYLVKPHHKEGFGDLADFLMFLIFSVSFLTTLITSLILDKKKK